MPTKNTQNEAVNDDVMSVIIIEGADNDDVMSVIIIEGAVCEARTGRTRFSETIKNRISLKSDAIPYDEIHAFDNSGDKLTPKWFKDKTGYISLASVYEIPVMTTNGRKISFDDWLENFNALGSEVRVSIIQKDGAIYPKAVKVLKDGEARDPFEDL